jgi:transcription elongation GreA/GreB family factor
MDIDKKRYSLLLEARKDILEEIKKTQEGLEIARSQGDLSENAGYTSSLDILKDLREEYRKIEEKIFRYLPSRNRLGNRIGVGDTVIVSCDRFAGVKELELCEPDTPIRDNIMFTDSELGKKILGKSDGVYRVITNLGLLTYNVKKKYEAS